MNANDQVLLIFLLCTCISNWLLLNQALLILRQTENILKVVFTKSEDMM